MNPQLSKILKDFQNEVDQEAIRLIQTGVLPYEAVGQATRNVQKKRQEEMSGRKVADIASRLR